MLCMYESKKFNSFLVIRGNYLIQAEKNENPQELCESHLWAPGCYHGSVGQGWEVVEKYISTQ